MLGGLVRLILLRLLGARVLLGIAVFEWLRRALAGRRDHPIEPGNAPGHAGAREGEGR